MLSGWHFSHQWTNITRRSLSILIPVEGLLEKSWENSHSGWFNRNVTDFNSFLKTLEIINSDTDKILLRNGKVHPKLSVYQQIYGNKTKVSKSPWACLQRKTTNESRLLQNILGVSMVLRSQQYHLVRLCRLCGRSSCVCKQKVPMVMYLMGVPFLLTKLFMKVKKNLLS